MANRLNKYIVALNFYEVTVKWIAPNEIDAYLENILQQVNSEPMKPQSRRKEMLAAIALFFVLCITLVHVYVVAYHLPQIALWEITGILSVCYLVAMFITTPKKSIYR